MNGPSDRHARGLAALERIGGPDAAAPILAIGDIAPDLARFAIDFAFGEVLSRPGLDPKTRELCTVAALTAIGHAVPQLKWHVDCALYVGSDAFEILEAVMLAAVVSGSAAVGTSLNTAREAFEARGVGSDALAAVDDTAARWCELPPTFESLELDARAKALIAIAALTAVGKSQPRIPTHVRAALAAGARREEVIEVIEQMALYAGFPAALNAMAAAREVLQRGGSSDSP